MAQHSDELFAQTSILLLMLALGLGLTLCVHQAALEFAAVDRLE